MKNRNKYTILTIVIISIILGVGAFFFIINNNYGSNHLSIVQKRWITDHKNQVIDADVFNDIPVYGYNGSGIIFDFLDYFEENNQIHFNKISYQTAGTYNINSDVSFLELFPNEGVVDKDILIDTDHYVIISQNKETMNDFTSLKKAIILKSDHDLLTKYFSEESISFVEYEDINKISLDVLKEEGTFLILPNLKYMNYILKNKLNIIYHLSDLELKYILRVRDDELYQIINNYFMEYLETDYPLDYSKNYLDCYFSSKGVNDLARKNYNSKTYKYGYVVNMPYENNVDGEFVGTISNYLKYFEKITNTSIDVVEYASINDLKSALVKGDIDFALANFDYHNLNFDGMLTSSFSYIDYVVLSKQDLVINSMSGLKGKKVSVVGGSILNTTFTSKGIKFLEYTNTDELIRNLDDESIVLLDKETYNFYLNSRLNDYLVIYENTIQDGNRFIMNQANATFNELYQYFISSIDYKNYKHQYHTTDSLASSDKLIKVVGFIFILIICLLISMIILIKRGISPLPTKRDEKLKYIDPMTSLKNRSYLNANIYDWDDNVIFPQSVVMLDVNGVKEINDKLGREAGDEVIKRIASILINHQLENTDIIRSGGDEFLIYMVGYDEKKVIEYTKLLSKEMKGIPNSLGIEVGYSMILDEVKSVDDAINEALSMLTKGKEKKK